MSLAGAAKTARNIGYISWAFEKTLKFVRTVGKKSYEVMANKPKYDVEIMVGEEHIEFRDKLSTKEINNLLKAMNTLDHVTLVVRRYKV